MGGTAGARQVHCGGTAIALQGHGDCTAGTRQGALRGTHLARLLTVAITLTGSGQTHDQPIRQKLTDLELAVRASSLFSLHLRNNTNDLHDFLPKSYRSGMAVPVWH